MLFLHDADGVLPEDTQALAAFGIRDVLCHGETDYEY